MNKTIDTYKKYMEKIQEGERVTPLQAIRLKCLDCSGFQPGEIKECTVKDCPLYLYRFKKNTTGFNSKGKKVTN